MPKFSIREFMKFDCHGDNVNLKLTCGPQMGYYYFVFISKCVPGKYFEYAMLFHAQLLHLSWQKKNTAVPGTYSSHTKRGTLSSEEYLDFLVAKEYNVLPSKILFH